MMNRKKRTITLAVFFAVTCATFVQNASAQRFRGRRGAGNFFAQTPLSLLTSRFVEAELELTKPQAELIASLHADLFTEYRNARPPRFGRGNNNENSGDYLPEKEVVSKASQAAIDLLETILEPQQFKRFSELQLQRAGLRAVVRDDMIKKLKLSDEQTGKAKELVGKLSGNYGRGPINDKDAEIAKQITKLLSKEQQDTWEKLLGEEFDFAP